MNTPFLVHFIFHPKSEAARNLALGLHRELNDDPALPGLRVPTVLAPEDGTGLPPGNYKLDDSERSVVIVLMDDEMVADDREGPQGTNWAQFVADLWEQCRPVGRRFIPVQMSENAWPLDDRLNGVNFLRAFAQPEAALKAWATRAIVIELCRFLEGKDRGDQLPLQLFVSHAKQDISQQPQVFNAIANHLSNDQPVASWIDSAKIPPGADFAERIESGIKNSIVMVLDTVAYSSRTWCRSELLMAKKFQRPLVIIEALEGLDVRSFPYGGNVPRLRWTEGGASRTVDLLLKETLRHLHAPLELARQQLPDDIILPLSPELATLVHIPKGSTVLYPGPPLGDEEIAALNVLGIRLETPLQRAAGKRLLEKKRVILSVSESGNPERLGLTQFHLDAALMEISRQLLVRGASLEYGGNLGTDGYTVALFDMARAYAAMSGLPPAERIINDVGWPLPLETLPVGTRAKYTGVATFRRIPRPDGVEALDPADFVAEPKFFQADSPKRRYAWARGMTAMREFQARSSNALARVVVGGKIGPPPDGSRVEKWYSGRIPGVVEEALLSLEAGQPLYLVGSFGGASALVIALLEDGEQSEFTWEYQGRAPHAEGMRDLYHQQGIDWKDYSEMTDFFHKTGVAGLAAVNKLSIEENRELFWSRDTTRIVELLLAGLTRIEAAK